MKTLIVEDDFTCRLILQKLLETYGECHLATNGKEALQAFNQARREEKPYHLLCLDIMMPDMDGQKVLREIRRIEQESGILLGKGAKVIMITALSDKDNVLEAFRQACDGYLVKPIEREKLTGLLRTFKLIK